MTGINKKWVYILGTLYKHFIIVDCNTVLLFNKGMESSKKVKMKYGKDDKMRIYAFTLSVNIL